MSLSQKQITTARSLAVQQLNRIEEEGAYIGLSRRDTDVDPREERQATDYVAGVTRWRRRFDFILSQFYRGDLEGMELTLKQILRIGMYDLLILDTPPHAALNEAVELAKKMVRPGAGGLVNGILRNVVRQRDRLPEPKMDDAAERLAITQSHPTWLVRRWLDLFGPADTETLLVWNNTRPTYGVRVNTIKTSMADFTARLEELEVAWEPSPYLDDFVRIQGLQPLIREGLLDEGLCAVQDESAGLIVRLLDPQPGETLVDACAAPGSKALYAAERMDNQGRVLAFDIHEGRLKMVRDAATDQGITIVETAAADLRELAKHTAPPQADRVLVDAPCSGLGVLAKRADLRWNRTPEEIKEMATLQDQLLAAAAQLVRPGGLLVYSTCTIDPEENHNRITAFLNRHPDFAVESAKGFVSDDLISPEGYLTTLPHRDQIDGAFGVRLRRIGG